MTLSGCTKVCEHGKTCRRFAEHPGLCLFAAHKGGDTCGVYPSMSERPTRENPPVVDNPRYQFRVDYPIGDAIAEILEAIATIIRERAKTGEPYIGVALY